MFDRVTPRVVASSALAIQVQAVDRDRPPGGVVLLAHPDPRLEWLHVERIAAQLPRPPLPTRAYAGEDSLRLSPGSPRPAASVLFWSPELEGDAGVSRGLCAAWPEAVLYVMYDEAGLSRAYAAQPQPGDWRPALPASRWRAGDCARSVISDQ